MNRLYTILFETKRTKALLAVLLYAVSAWAQPRVLVLAADEPTGLGDVQSKLTATGLFASVATFDARSTTPTLMQLQAYDAVLVYNYFRFFSNIDVGNVLASYVDGGGGVVVGVFGNTNWNPMAGNWSATNRYQVFNTPPYTFTSRSLGTVNLPSHPIMGGVSSLTGGSMGVSPTLIGGSYSIARWNNGDIAIAAREDAGSAGNRRRVDLNFFPRSTSIISSGWSTSTNGDRIMANALLWVAGSVPSSLNFDGTNDRVSIPHRSNQVGMSSLTLEAWVFITGSNGNFRNVIMKGNYGYGMAIDSNNKLGYWSNSLYGNCPRTAASIPFNTWTHVAVVVNQGVSTTFYINGVNAGSSTSPGHTTINAGSNDSLYLGFQGSGCNCNYFSGSMDEVRVWNTARTATQIRDGMNCSLTSSTNLIANYNFNNGQPGVNNTGRDTLSDVSGNWNRGFLRRFALTGATSNWSTPAIGHEIDVTGNSVPIADGNTALSTTDSTDFGIVNFGTRRRYTIRNTGQAALRIDSIRVSGTNASEFVVSGAPTSVAANSSAMFTVTFNPAVAGSARNATLNIFSNDCDEALYNFAIRGQAATIPGASLHFSGWQNSGGGSNSNPSVHDFIEVPDNGTLDLDNNYTIEAWVNVDDNNNNTIIDKGNYRYLFQTHPNGQTGLGLYNPSMGWVYSSGTVPTSTWTHVAVTFDATAQRVVFYMNGNLLSSHTNGNAGPVASPGPDNGVITIGRQQPSGCVCNNFDGRMDQLRIWTRTLCQDEIQARMNCEIPTSATGLAANYLFNQGAAGGSNGSINTLTDASGNGNTGTLTNFALTGSTSNWVAPGGVTTGSSCGTYNAPEINVTGNTITILDGDITPSLTDSTDFGVVLSGTSRRFTIENTGGNTLNISSITVSGTNASEFIVSGAPTSIAPGSNARFSVRFNPGAAGARTATININSNDCDEALYNFNIQGTRINPGATLNFDGSSDNVRVAHNAILNPSTALTLEAWVFRTASQYSTVIAKWDDDNNNRGYMMNFGELGNNDRLCFVATNTGNWLPSPRIQWQTNTSLNLNQWYHVAITFTQNGTNNVKYYLNGVLTDQTTWNFSINATNPIDLLIGGYDGPGNGQNVGANSRYFAGNIDEVRIWGRERTCSEINSTMNRELVGNETGLLAYYQFNQGAANSPNAGVTTLPDLQTNTAAKNGTLNTFTLSGNTSNWIAPGSGVSGTTPDAQPEINVRGNGAVPVNILDNDLTPSLTDSTDFGRVVSGTRRRFRIENTGTGLLTISSITVSGTHATNFTIANAPASIAAGASADILVTFNSTAGGVRSATININSNDCDEALYNFAIQAEILCSFASPLASSVATHTSAFSATTPGGWTCYCNSSGELLLALRLGGTGAVIPASGGVELKVNSTNATWYPHGTGFVGNFQGWAGLNRTWEVYPTTQPSSPVPVRFYLQTADINALNTTLSANGAPNISTVSQMSFYKVVNNAKPAHSAVANLGQNDVAIYCNTSSALGEIAFSDSSYGGGKFHAQFNVTSFSGGGGGSGGLGLTPLPVSFLALKAERIEETSARVYWTVEEAAGVISYTVERSLNGIDFTEAGIVNGQGREGVRLNYSFTDLQAPAGMVYYRIRVNNLSGLSEFSHAVVLTGRPISGSDVPALITVQPNPASRIANVLITLSEDAESSVLVYELTDMTGKILMQGDMNVTPGQVSSLQIPADRFKSGVYLFKSKLNDTMLKTQRIMISQ